MAASPCKTSGRPAQERHGPADAFSMSGCPATGCLPHADARDSGSVLVRVLVAQRPRFTSMALPAAVLRVPIPHLRCSSRLRRHIERHLRMLRLRSQGSLASENHWSGHTLWLLYTAPVKVSFVENIRRVPCFQCSIGH